MDWVDVFAPVVFEAYRPRSWPASGSLLLDDLPFRVRDPKTGRTRVAFRIFAAMGYERGRGKQWRLEAFTTKSEADWEAFVGALDGAPAAGPNSPERTAALSGWLELYNWQRPHGALNHKPPGARLHELNNLLGSYT
jgi:hypothetical protein